MKICLFGGSFNPIHISHALAIHYLATTGGFDKIAVIPTYKSPAGKDLIDFTHRYNMVKLAVGFIPNVHVSYVEKNLSLNDGKPNFTINTIKFFKKIYPNDELRLAIGADILSTTNLWDPNHLKEIFEIAPPFILGRFGYEHPDAVGPIIPGVSSTKVKELLKSQNQSELSKIVPTNVLNYIKENKLYE